MNERQRRDCRAIAPHDPHWWQSDQRLPFDAFPSDPGAHQCRGVLPFAMTCGCMWGEGNRRDGKPHTLRVVMGCGAEDCDFSSCPEHRDGLISAHGCPIAATHR